MTVSSEMDQTYTPSTLLSHRGGVLEAGFSQRLLSTTNLFRVLVSIQGHGIIDISSVAQTGFTTIRIPLTDDWVGKSDKRPVQVEYVRWTKTRP